VADLKDELQQLADDAARQVRPLPVAEVIRQGDSRHQRITRGSLTGTRAARRGTSAGGLPSWPGSARRSLVPSVGWW
jgi:hypothetical protein